MDFMLILALVVLAMFLMVYVHIAVGLRKIKSLDDYPAGGLNPSPRVSVIIPALNEATTIEPALASVLGLDYDNLEIIAVNDRSTDSTAEVLECMRQKHPRLQVIHIETLPEGWLGKNHALMMGAARASGDYLLFTDADIEFEASTLKRAMHYVLTRRLDHLSMFFEARVKSGLLAAMIVEFGGGLLMQFKPWKAKDPRSKSYMGIGAFNLVRAAVYQQVGTHQAIAMAPIDDIMLGKLIKIRGFRQDCLLGYGYLAVGWYRSAGEMVQGLQKNIFAAFNFNLAAVACATAMTILVGLLPQIAVWFVVGPARLVLGLIILLRLLAFADGAGKNGYPVRYAPWTLISPVLTIYTTWRAVINTLLNNGITWRGTFYPLAELKRHKL